MVAPRIVVFGATGYTGDLTARALVAAGRTPVLAGRTEARVRALAEELGGLEHAVADVERPESLHALVGRGDVLISTVGPFLRLGEPALAAATRAGAHYLDSTGEPPFIRKVFETWGPRAMAAGSALLTAMGYDYVPGNLAGALALRDAGPQATAVEIGYFAVGPMSSGGASGGTRASLAGVLFESGFAHRDGGLVTERAGVRYRTFTAAGKERPALSLGGTEHFTLPRVHTGLSDVGVYLGWFGSVTPVASVLSRVVGPVGSLPPIKKVVGRGLSAVVKGSTGGPGPEVRSQFRTVVVAEAKGEDGTVLARATVEGTNPYDFTGEMLAWAAGRIADGGLQGTGALGPVDAFTLDALHDGARGIGLTRTG